jgi:hypothetical protein
LFRGILINGPHCLYLANLCNMYISLSSQTTLNDPDNFLAFALYDASAPTVLLETVTPPKPYGDPLQINFLYNCQSGKIYNIKLWESVDGTATGTVRNSMSQSVNQNSVLVRMPDYLEVDVTPGFNSGAIKYTDSSYIGWDYLLRRNPVTMIPDDTDATDPTIHKDLSEGSFELITFEDTFQPNEVFIVEFIPQVIVTAPAGTPSPVFSTGRIITASETLTGADVGKALFLQGAGLSLALGLPTLAGLPDYAFLYLYSNGGIHINAGLIGAGTDKILVRDQQSSMYLGQAETVRLFKANGVWNLDSPVPGVLQVGDFVYNYGLTRLNTVQCAGQLLARANYPRLWAWVQTLDSASIVSDTAWNSTFVTHNGGMVYTKKGCFSTGDGSTTFRMPLLSNMILKGVDGAVRKSGSLELDEVGPHTHSFQVNENGTGNSISTPAFPAITDNSGVAKGTAATAVNTGLETIPRNSGAYCLMRC